VRERRPDDWQHDLAARHEIEDLVARELECHACLDIERRSTDRFDILDFQVIGPGGRRFDLEIKAKHQPLSFGWTRLRPEVPERDLFVLDELGMRKIVDAGRYAFLLVRDAPSERWVLWSSGDLVAATRVRAERRLERSTVHVSKGKLLLNLSEAGASTTTAKGALDAMTRLIPRIDALWCAVGGWPHVDGVA
jgi:hypothetical protein